MALYCPKCGDETRVVDNAESPENEVFRHRKCKSCNHTFYTMECEVETTGQFLTEWRECHRTTKRAHDKYLKKRTKQWGEFKEAMKE